MNVVHMADFQKSETVSILKCLLEKAKNGEVTGIAVCLKRSDGKEDAYFSGFYRSRPAEACSATLRLSMRISRLQGERM